MEINKILAELYALDPSLKEHEEVLITLIGRMSDLKPDTKFDKHFAARLKKEVLQQDNNFKINFNLMNKKIYLIASSVAVLGVVAILIGFNYKFFPDQNLVIPSNSNNVADSRNATSETAVVKLLDGAYGNLAVLTDAGSAVNQTNTQPLAPVSTLGGMSVNSGSESVGSGGGITNSKMMTSPSFSGRSSVQGTVSAVAPDMAVGSTINTKMMVPNYGYKYVYKGEPLDLKDLKGDVYRRVKGDGQMGKDLASLISSQNFDLVNLKSFQDLKMTNLSLMEDKDLGLMINFDFNEDNIYISENWEKWRNLAREACLDDACFNRFQLKIADVPDNNIVISLADNFLKTYNVNLEHYGQAIVEDTWRADYKMMADTNNYYVPEYMTVVYPLLVNGEAVRDQSGNYTGLRVTVNLTKKLASGLNGLTPYRFESSAYALETDSNNVIKAIENGGWNRFYYMQTADVKELELGTPVKSLVQTWKYDGNKSEELMVPALIFPILNAPAEYYGNKFITVPLVKEMLDELNNQSSWSGGSGGVPVPMGGPATIMLR